jgi:hypothetical protein
VVLEATATGTSAGRFSAHLRSAAEGSRLTVTGSFQGLSIRTAPKNCAGRPAHEADEDEELDLYEESDEPPESAD